MSDAGDAFRNAIRGGAFGAMIRDHGFVRRFAPEINGLRAVVVRPRRQSRSGQRSGVKAEIRNEKIISETL